MNINGGLASSNPFKIPMIQRHLEENNLDILICTEVRHDLKQYENLRRKSAFPEYVILISPPDLNPFSNHNDGGVLVLIRKSFQQFIKLPKDGKWFTEDFNFQYDTNWNPNFNPYRCIPFRISNPIKIQTLAIYAPASNHQVKETFWKQMKTQAESVRGEALLIAGDFNQDLRACRHTLSYNKLKATLTTDAPADGYTFDDGQRRSQIDGFMYTVEIKQKLKSYQLEECSVLAGDHSPVTLEIGWINENVQRVTAKIKDLIDSNATRKVPGRTQARQELKKGYAQLNKTLSSSKNVANILHEIQKLEALTTNFGLDKVLATDTITKLWNEYVKVLDETIESTIGWTFIARKKEHRRQWSKELEEQYSRTSALRKIKLSRATNIKVIQDVQKAYPEIYSKLTQENGGLDKRKVVKFYNHEHNKLRKLVTQMNKSNYRQRIQQLIEAHIINPSKFFNRVRQMASEFKSRNQVQMNGIKLNGSISTDPLTILRAIIEYWKNFFCAKEINKPDLKDHFLQQSDIQKIHQRVQNHPLSYFPDLPPAEILQAIQRSENDTMPGPDNITYQIWSSLSEPNLKPFITFLQFGFKHQVLPEQWKLSYLSMIHKGGDPNEVVNYRPITLGNTAYKIFMNVVRCRMELICEESNLMSPSQGGFTKGQSCADKIYTLLNLRKIQKEKQEHIHLCYIDFSKAYDTVSHQLLLKFLKHWGFPPYILKILKEVYTGNHIQIITPWGLTQRIPVNRGIKQGCPLSPLLFNLYIEILIRAVNRGKNGISCNGKTLGILAFADDLVLTHNSLESQQKDIQILEKWCQYTRMEVNHGPNKTVHTTDEPNPGRLTLDNRMIHLLPPNECYKYLGIWMSLTEDWNYQAKKIDEKIDKILYGIHHRFLTFDQRIIIINRILIAAIAYRMQVINFPKTTIREWKAKIYKHLANKTSSIKFPQEVLFLPENKGGFGLIDLQHLQTIQLTIGNLNYNLNSQNKWSRLTARTLKEGTPEPMKYKDPLHKINVQLARIDKDKNPLTLEYWMDSINLRKSCRRTTLMEKTIENMINPEGELLPRIDLIKLLPENKHAVRQRYPEIQQVLCVPGSRKIRPEVLIETGLFVIPQEEVNQVEIWTDGSYDGNERAISGVLTEHMQITTKTRGHASSFNAELEAIRLALKAYRETTIVRIYTDNMACVQLIRQLSSHPKINIRKTKYPITTREIQSYIQERQIEVDGKEIITPCHKEKTNLLSISHVYSHLLDENQQDLEQWNRKMKETKNKFGNDTDRILQMNQRVDLILNEVPDTAVALPFHPACLEDFTLCSDGNPIDESIRPYLKLKLSQQTIRKLFQKPKTSQTMQNIQNVNQLLVEKAITPAERFFLKKLIWNKLPTKWKIHQMLMKETTKYGYNEWRTLMKEKYEDEKCIFCEQPETIQHLLMDCPFFSEARHDLQEEVAKTLQTYLNPNSMDGTIPIPCWFSNTLPRQTGNIHWIPTDKWEPAEIFTSLSPVDNMYLITDQTHGLTKKLNSMILSVYHEIWRQRCTKIHQEFHLRRRLKRKRPHNRRNVLPNPTPSQSLKYTHKVQQVLQKLGIPVNPLAELQLKVTQQTKMRKIRNSQIKKITNNSRAIIQNTHKRAHLRIQQGSQISKRKKKKKKKKGERVPLIRHARR